MTETTLNAFTGSIRGRVQGVGFRYFARKRALELNITGWVRNLPDGNVEVLAIGPISKLEQFMHYLQTGPMGSRVENTEFQWVFDPGKWKGFEIIG